MSKRESVPATELPRPGADPDRAAAPGAAEEDEAAAVRLGTKPRLYLLAMFIDTIGSGLWTPVGLIFFAVAQRLPVTQVGLALTVGGVVGLLVGPASGNLIDRWGAGRFVFVSNAVRTGVFVLYPVVQHAWQVALLAALFSAADRLFWTANTPLLGTFVSGRRLDRMFATQNVLRVVGLGGGAALSGLFAGSVTGLHVLAYLNAGSYLVAALIVVVIGLAIATPSKPHEPAAGAKTGWRVVLADGPYVLFCVVQALYALCSRSIVVILPLVALDPFGGPQWLPGACIAAAAGTLALVQKPAIAKAEKAPRLRGLTVASLVLAIAFAPLAFGVRLDRTMVIVLVLAAAVVGVVGEALFGPMMTAAANEAAPEGLRGRYSALFQTAWGLATVLSPAVFTALLAVGNAVLWLTLVAVALLTIPGLRFIATRYDAAYLRST